MNLIVAVDENWAIGRNGDLLAHMKEDMKFFRRATNGRVVLMGRKTLDSFPGGNPLKNRTNIVLHPDPAYAPEGAIVAHSLDELFEILKNYNTDDVYIIGGASVYRQMLPYCDTAIITKFDKSFEKDVFIPNLDELADWRLESVSDVMYSDAETDTEGGLPFTFCTYKRIS